MWWAAMADYASRFLGHGLLATANDYLPALVMAAGLMILGLVVATVGTTRIVRAELGRRGPNRLGPVGCTGVYTGG